jgi:hypothetical protein
MKPIVLTSKLTLLYKIILPAFFGLVTLLIWIAAIALVNEPDGQALIVIAAIFTGIFFLLMLPPMFVQKANYDDQFLYANNFKRTKKIPLNRIKALHRWLFYFYRIDYLDEANRLRKIYILPSITERFEAMMGMPASLEIFEDEVISQ